jgi:general stress protein YciG
MSQDTVVNAQSHSHGHGDRHEQETPIDASQGRPAEKKSNRGFASMDPAKQREIASKGGRAAHEKGTAHQFSANEAREAGKKGGGTVSQDRHHMAEIGRIGGQARGRKQRASSEQPGPETSESKGTEGSNEDAGEGGDPKRTNDYRH